MSGRRVEESRTSARFGAEPHLLLLRSGVLVVGRRVMGDWANPSAKRSPPQSCVLAFGHASMSCSLRRSAQGGSVVSGETWPWQEATRRQQQRLLPVSLALSPPPYLVLWSSVVEKGRSRPAQDETKTITRS